MKTKLLLLILPVLSNILSAQQPVIQVATRPDDYEYLSASDSLGHRSSLKMPLTTNSASRSSRAQLPYPIIFIHGLDSYSEKWNSTTDFMDANYDMLYGGRIDYCLNYDDNNNTAGWNSDIRVWNPSYFIRADYYYVNFDVGWNGGYHPDGNNYDVISNQSAIRKQGIALSDAIYRVMQITGRDKVVLMGHSMGGLAAREYLQNSELWQADGMSHVAKLITTGTPHGGSNVVTAGVIYGPDGQSEAVRDLRRTYYYTGNPGVYLFGGIEYLPYMDDQLCCYFYNSDVNCNGVGGTSESITGLNSKNIYSNLAYSCIIGECPNCINSGDGIVSSSSADLRSYYALFVNRFRYYDYNSIIEIHTDLPELTTYNMLGLDEPDDFDLSYKINLDTTYIGFTTTQSLDNSNYPIDFDLYKFTLTTTTKVGVSISNISLPYLSGNILDANHQIVSGGFNNNSTSNIKYSQILSPGDYYLNIYGTATGLNYVDPYNFELNRLPIGSFTSSNDIVCQGMSLNFVDQSSENPISWSWIFPGGTPSTSTLKNPTIVYNTPGTYPVTLVARNSAGSDTVIATNYITVNPLPSGVGSITGLTSVCQGQQSVTYSVLSGTNATSYVWSLPNGTIGTSNTNSITVNYGSSAASGNVSVRGQNSCGLGAISNLSITVNTIPSTPGSITGLTTVCKGQQSVTYSIQPIANATSYVWNLSNGTTGTSTTNSIIVNFSSSATSGNIAVQAQNSCGLGGTYSLPISVNTIPSDAGAITGLSSICQGQTGVTYYIDTVPNTTSYTWTLPNGTWFGSSMSNSIITTVGNSSGSISVKPNNSCGSGSASSLNVVVHAAPIVNAGLNQTYIQGGSSVIIGGNPTASGVGPYSYKWSPSIGLDSDSVSNPEVSNITATTIYTVTVTDANGCTAKSQVTITLDVSTQTIRVPNSNLLQIFPNPSNGSFTVNFETIPSKRAELRVFNLIGQQIWSENLGKITGKLSKEIQLFNVAKGIYIVQLKLGNEFINRRVEIQ